MPNQIIWSPLSEQDFSDILEFLDENWGAIVANQFIDIADNYLKQIAINPKQFPVIFKKMKVRKCVITKHNTIFYREGKDRIEVLRIYDTRQDPQKLRFK